MKRCLFPSRFLVGWLIIFVFLCAMGKWQLTRWHFKRNLIATVTEQLQAQPVPFSDVSQKYSVPPAFLRVSLSGIYQSNDTVLVQNQFYQHRVGVRVLTPVLMQGHQKWLLVDRGWLALPAMQTLPVIPPVRGVQDLVGYLKPLGEYQFTLGRNILDTAARPLVIQKIDLVELGRVLSVDFYPFLLKLDPASSNGFIRDTSLTAWVAVPPERHLGYAIQWFTMALVLLIACVCWYLKKGAICPEKKL